MEIGDNTVELVSSWMHWRLRRQPCIVTSHDQLMISVSTYAALDLIPPETDRNTAPRTERWETASHIFKTNSVTLKTQR